MKRDKQSRILFKIFMDAFATVALAALIALLGGIVDGMVVSRAYDNNVLAAFGLASPLNLVIIGVGLIFGSSLLALATEAVGRGDIDEARRIFTFNLFTGITVGIILMVLGYIFKPQILDILGATGDNEVLREQTGRYIDGMLPMLPLTCILQSFNSVLQIEGKSKLILLGGILMTASNILMDILVAFVLKTDLLGLSLATSLSHFGFFIPSGIYLFSSKCAFGIDFNKLPWHKFGALFTLGISSAAIRIYTTFRSVIANRALLTAGGIDAVSAWSVRTSIMNFFEVIPTRFGPAVIMVACFLIGEKDREGLNRFIKIAITVPLAISLGVTAVIILIASPIVSIFLPGASEISMIAVEALRVSSISIIFMGVSGVLSGMLQSGGRITFANIYLLLSELLLPCVLILSVTYLGTTAIFWACSASGAIILIIYLIFRTIGCKHFPKTGFELFMINSDFGVNENQVLERSLSTMDEVVTFSASADEFLKSQGVDSKKKFVAALAIEEMAGNIVKHGFKKDNKKHSVDIRLVVEGDKITLRFRDDCISFNPIERCKIYKETEGDHASHIGMRMIMDMCTDVNYTSVMNLNNLIITV